MAPDQASPAAATASVVRYVNGHVLGRDGKPIRGSYARLVLPERLDQAAEMRVRDDGTFVLGSVRSGFAWLDLTAIGHRPQRVPILLGPSPIVIDARLAPLEDDSAAARIEIENQGAPAARMARAVAEVERARTRFRLALAEEIERIGEQDLRAIEAWVAAYTPNETHDRLLRQIAMERDPEVRRIMMVAALGLDAPIAVLDVPASRQYRALAARALVELEPTDLAWSLDPAAMGGAIEALGTEEARAFGEQAVAGHLDPQVGGDYLLRRLTTLRRAGQSSQAREVYHRLENERFASLYASRLEQVDPDRGLDGALRWQMLAER